LVWYEAFCADLAVRSKPIHSGVENRTNRKSSGDITESMSRRGTSRETTGMSGLLTWKGSFAMDFGKLTFGSIEVDGVTYEHDVIIDRGRICKRKKKASKRFRKGFGHTPLSLEEEIPWKCRRMVIGTGNYGSLPVMDEVKLEALRRDIDLLIVPTEQAIETLAQAPKDTNAILHVTC
jgi:hypothetical protein